MHPEANVTAIDYDPGASEVNQLNRIKLMLASAFLKAGEAGKQHEKENKDSAEDRETVN